MFNKIKKLSCFRITMTLSNHVLSQINYNLPHSLHLIVKSVNFRLSKAEMMTTIRNVRSLMHFKGVIQKLISVKVSRKLLWWRVWVLRLFWNRTRPTN